MDVSFTDLEVVQGDKKVVWEWIGEGCDGDYDENDSNDVPLLRFSCSQLKNNEWMELPDSSYCTRMPVDTINRHLLIAAGIILEAIQRLDYKKKLEHLSWFCPSDFD